MPCRPGLLRRLCQKVYVVPKLLLSPSHSFILGFLTCLRRLLPAGLLLLLPLSASAHFTLYYNIEVNLSDPRLLLLHVTIHDPDIEEGETDASFITQNFGFDPALEFEATLVEDATDIPEDCHLITMAAKNPGGDFEVTLDPEAQKRLLLVVSRPKAFPVTRDVGPGQTYILELGDKPPMHFGLFLIYLFAVSGALALTVFLLRWRSFASVAR